MLSDGNNSLITHLMELVNKEDRGALAALRKGLGKEPGDVPEMFEHVIPFIPSGMTLDRENAFFLMASLFASYPNRCGRGDMGATFRSISNATNSDSIEKRFVGLLKCHRDDLPDHLRHAVALARSKDALIDWDQLLYDIQRWDDEAGSVQRRWGRSFWDFRESDGTDLKKEE